MPAHRGQESWALIDDMFETMRERQGIGLAAPQVHEGLRLFVAGVDDPEANLPPVVMINPVVEPAGSATEEDWEGCLSIPDVRGRVPRAADVRVEALDRFGVRHAMTASGFPARVIQHETDHLDGVLFLDRMSSFRKPDVPQRVRPVLGAGERGSGVIDRLNRPQPSFARANGSPFKRR